MTTDLVPAGKPQRRRIPTHGPNGDFIRTVEQAERDAEAARLRSRSMSYRQIAREMGVDVHTAHDMVKRALADVVRESAEATIANESAKLDYLEAQALAVLERDHVVVSNGRVMRDGDGKALLDDGPKLAAIGHLRALSESRRKLFGADAAQKIDTTAAVKFTYQGVDTDDV